MHVADDYFVHAWRRANISPLCSSVPAEVFSMFARAQLKFLNAAYFIGVAGLAAVVLYVSWNMGSWYANWPTYIKTEIVEQMRADFPAVTVCKLDPCERGDGRTRNCTGFRNFSTTSQSLV